MGQDLTDWIGRGETATGRMGTHQAAMMAATLNVPPLDPGAALPPLWHWATMPTQVPTQDLGHDGHPRKGGFLPPVELPRRMWAGGAVDFDGDLHLGEALTRHSNIANVVEKRGRAGPMVFVTVNHVYSGASGQVRERHDIVYLQSPDRYAPPPPVAPPANPVIERTHDMTAVMLFRYSACTFNGHRIHYDLDFAREVEKYPGLLVHGPLQATLMMMAATEHRGRRPDHFRYRGVHPMFPDGPMRVLGVETDEGLSLCTAKGMSHQGMQATATWTIP